MSLNPLNELKRCLDDDSTPLPKRLCLAKNVVQSHHFPTAPKERVVAVWLEGLMQKNRLSSTELKDVIGWLNTVDDLTSELKSKLIQVVSQFLQRNPLQNDNVQCILTFLENSKISSQLILQIDDYLLITVTLLQYLRNDATLNSLLSQRLMNGLVKYYRDCKKKLEFIVKFIDGENLETIFSYLDTDCRNTVIYVCQNILFSNNKKSFFASFLQTLIRKDNIDELIAEKGDNIQSVLKIMSTFFTFPKGRTEKNEKFLSDFIEVFVSCFKNESQLIFAVYIMFINSLNMNQSYISPAMIMPPIIFDENDDKIKRSIFLKMLEILLKNEIDISVRLTDTFGEKISKVEVKKNFTTLLQATMMGQLKLEGKLDKTTLQIIKTALKLDPVLIERKLDQIVPSIMTAKKNSSNTEAYVETMNCLLEILFKLSKGTVFITEILPQVKLSLEAGNTEQFEIKQKIKESADSGMDCEKLKKKLITGSDLLPQECIELYGKLTSELMFRQNKELLVSLQKDFEEHCLMMLEEGFVSPSIITLAEVLSAILSSFLRYNKMADHTVPRQIAEDFWSAFRKFEDESLRKFGECVLKLSYNPPLQLSFLKLCLSVSQLKLLNMKYGNTKIDAAPHTSKVFDLSVILPCLSGEQWIALAEKIEDDEAVLVLDNLLLAKTMVINILSKNEDEKEAISPIKTHLLKQIAKSNILESNNYIAKVLFTDLEKSQAKQIAKTLVKLYLNDPEMEILKSDAVKNNRLILNALVTETAKNLTKCFENCEDLSNGLNKIDFDLISFTKDVDMKKYFEQITLKENQDGVLLSCVEILKQLPVHCLEEPYQLIAVFCLLLAKKCSQTKKLQRIIDSTLRSLYELSPKYPDLYKIFSVNFIFSFEDRILLELLTLRIKNSNSMLIIKSVLETAVKKVKTNNEVVKNIVELLISKDMNRKGDKTSIEYFSDPVFQISCIILPIIVKEKKAITTSAFRSILANLQEKLHKSMLDAFENIDFGSNSSFNLDVTGNTDSLVVSENTLATLNAMGAYSLTLSKYCETTNAEEIKNLDYLWSGLEFFMLNAIQSIQNPSTKNQHIESSIQLLNVVLRHTKKLDSHPIFEKKDQIFIQIWKSIIARLLIAYEQKEKRKEYLEDISVTLKFVCELSSVECFGNNFIGEMEILSVFKKPSQIKEESPSQLTTHNVSKYLWTQCLKANIVGPKCVALSKLISKTTKNLRLWIQLHYENQDGGVVEDKKSKKEEFGDYQNDESEVEVKVFEVDDFACDLLWIELYTLSEVILAAKKISLDYKLLDSTFELQHLIHYIMGRNAVAVRCEISWQAFFKLFDGSMAILNSLLVSREELLEDRWPNYMQCYRALAQCLCERASRAHDRATEERLAEIAHSVEKLTQSICKRKAHVSRIAAYTVADICALLERSAPSKMVRQHLENSVALLIQASDSSYAMAFLRRALAGSPGQNTMTNLYTMYKRYHKYVGNS